MSDSAYSTASKLTLKCFAKSLPEGTTSRNNVVIKVTFLKVKKPLFRRRNQFAVSSERVDESTTSGRGHHVRHKCTGSLSFSRNCMTTALCRLHGSAILYCRRTPEDELFDGVRVHAYKNTDVQVVLHTHTHTHHVHTHTHFGRVHICVDTNKPN